MYKDLSANILLSKKENIKPYKKNSPRSGGDYFFNSQQPIRLLACFLRLRVYFPALLKEYLVLVQAYYLLRQVCAPGFRYFDYDLDLTVGDPWFVYDLHWKVALFGYFDFGVHLPGTDPIHCLAYQDSHYDSTVPRAGLC